MNDHDLQKQLDYINKRHNTFTEDAKGFVQRIDRIESDHHRKFTDMERLRESDIEFYRGRLNHLQQQITSLIEPGSQQDTRHHPLGAGEVEHRSQPTDENITKASAWLTCNGFNDDDARYIAKQIIRDITLTAPVPQVQIPEWVQAVSITLYGEYGTSKQRPNHFEMQRVQTGDGHSVEEALTAACEKALDTTEE